MLSSQKREHPINIDPAVAEKFKVLRNDVQKFSVDFTLYLAEKKQELQAEAEILQEKISKLKANIEEYVICSRYV